MRCVRTKSGAIRSPRCPKYCLISLYWLGKNYQENSRPRTRWTKSDAEDTQHLHELPRDAHLFRSVLSNAHRRNHLATFEAESPTSYFDIIRVSPDYQNRLKLSNRRVDYLTISNIGHDDQSAGKSVRLFRHLPGLPWSRAWCVKRLQQGSFVKCVHASDLPTEL